jgi:hypothetical protein
LDLIDLSDFLDFGLLTKFLGAFCCGLAFLGILGDMLAEGEKKNTVDDFFDFLRLEFLGFEIWNW